MSSRRKKAIISKVVQPSAKKNMPGVMAMPFTEFLTAIPVVADPLAAGARSDAPLAMRRSAPSTADAAITRFEALRRDLSSAAWMIVPR